MKANLVEGDGQKWLAVSEGLLGQQLRHQRNNCVWRPFLIWFKMANHKYHQEKEQSRLTGHSWKLLSLNFVFHDFSLASSSRGVELFDQITRILILYGPICSIWKQNCLSVAGKHTALINITISLPRSFQNLAEKYFEETLPMKILLTDWSSFLCVYSTTTTESDE